METDDAPPESSIHPEANVRIYSEWRNLQSKPFGELPTGASNPDRHGVNEIVFLLQHAPAERQGWS